MAENFFFDFGFHNFFSFSFTNKDKKIRRFLEEFLCDLRRSRKFEI